MLKEINRDLILIGATGSGKSSLIKEFKNTLDKEDTLMISVACGKLDNEALPELLNRMKESYKYENATMFNAEYIVDFDINTVKSFKTIIIEDINFSTEQNNLMLSIIKQIINMDDINLLLTIQSKYDIKELDLKLSLMGNNYKSGYKKLELYEVV